MGDLDLGIVSDTLPIFIRKLEPALLKIELGALVSGFVLQLLVDVRRLARRTVENQGSFVEHERTAAIFRDEIQAVADARICLAAFLLTFHTTLEFHTKLVSSTGN